MNKGFIIFGGVSILVGIVLLYLNAIFMANFELVKGVGILELERYGFYYYPTFCFSLGAIFISLDILLNYKKIIEIIKK